MGDGAALCGSFVEAARARLAAVRASPEDCRRLLAAQFGLSSLPELRPEEVLAVVAGLRDAAYAFAAEIAAADAQGSRAHAFATSVHLAGTVSADPGAAPSPLAVAVAAGLPPPPAAAAPTAAPAAAGLQRSCSHALLPEGALPAVRDSWAVSCHAQYRPVEPAEGARARAPPQSKGIFERLPASD